MVVTGFQTYEDNKYKLNGFNIVLSGEERTYEEIGTKYTEIYKIGLFKDSFFIEGTLSYEIHLDENSGKIDKSTYSIQNSKQNGKYTFEGADGIKSSKLYVNGNEIKNVV